MIATGDKQIRKVERRRRKMEKNINEIPANSCIDRGDENRNEKTHLEKGKRILKK